MSTNERRKRRRDEREKRSSPRFSRWWISRNKSLRAEMWWPLIVCLIVPTLLCPSLAASAADGCDWIGRLVLFFGLKQTRFYLCVIRKNVLETGTIYYVNVANTCPTRFWSLIVSALPLRTVQKRKGIEFPFFLRKIGERCWTRRNRKVFFLLSYYLSLTCQYFLQNNLIDAILFSKWPHLFLIGLNSFFQSNNDTPDAVPFPLCLEILPCGLDSTRFLKCGSPFSYIFWTTKKSRGLMEYNSIIFHWVGGISRLFFFSVHSPLPPWKEINFPPLASFCAPLVRQ